MGERDCWQRDLKLSLRQVIFFAQHVSILRALHLITRNLGTTKMAANARGVRYAG
jgi:hypothetical protein